MFGSRDPQTEKNKACIGHSLCSGTGPDKGRKEAVPRG